MPRYQPTREIIRELNTTYFHDKRMPLDVSLFISGPSNKNVRLVIDRAAGIKIIKQFTEMDTEEPGKSMYYVYDSLQYTDEYSVNADGMFEIQIWRESERAAQ